MAAWASDGALADVPPPAGWGWSGWIGSARGAGAMEHQAEAVGTASTRLGPRPLPLHLAIATHDLAQPARGTWPLWSQRLAALEAPTLLADAGAGRRPGRRLERKVFTAALESETRARFDRLAAGIESIAGTRSDVRFRSRPSCGRTAPRVCSTIAPDRRAGLCVLAVPSLINRAHILDLTADRSLLGALAAAGTRPLLVDWGTPGDWSGASRSPTTSRGAWEQALDHVLAEVGGPVVLLGYCMGGLLTGRPRPAAATPTCPAWSCLATPWDFHAERPSQAKLLGASLGLARAVAAQHRGILPVRRHPGALRRPSTRCR